MIQSDRSSDSCVGMRSVRIGLALILRITALVQQENCLKSPSEGRTEEFNARERQEGTNDHFGRCRTMLGIAKAAQRVRSKHMYRGNFYVD